MDKKDALELYKLFRQEDATWMDSHRDHLHHYATLISAILAASIAAVWQLKGSVLLLFALIGPIVNIVLCRLGRDMCDRAYRAFLEGISVQAKLEPMIGLVGQRPPTGDSAPFAQDEAIVPERWIKGRRDWPTSEQFVSAHMGSSANGTARSTFTLLMYINIAAVVLIVLALIWAVLPCICIALNRCH